MKISRVHLFFATLVLVGVVGCVGGLTKPENLDQRLAYANGQVTAVVNATAASLEGQQITSKEAIAVRTIAQQSAVLLDTAQAATTDSDKLSNLELATQVLTEAQKYLNTRTKK